MSRVGIFIGDKEVIKRYVGDKLVWENTKKITLKVTESVSKFRNNITLKNVPIKEIKEIISLEVTYSNKYIPKRHLGTITKSQIKSYELYSWGDLRISFVDDLGKIGFNNEILANSDVVMTYR